MKNQTKATLIAIAIAGATAASHAAAYNNDLIIGFSSTSGNDLLYDLGSFSSLSQGETWNLSALLSGYNLSTVNWGVSKLKILNPRSPASSGGGTKL